MGEVAAWRCERQSRRTHQDVDVPDKLIELLKLRNETGAWRSKTEKQPSGAKTA
jgi:hypothetical protein